MGGNQEIVHVVGVDFAGDSGVVAGGAGVFHDGSGVGGEPQKTENGGVQSGVCGAQVVEREQSFSDAGDFRDVEGRGGSIADGDDGSGLESGRGDEIVMWSWRVLGGAERAGVDDGALKGASRTFLFHFVGGGREDLCDAAGSSPSYNVVGAAAGAEQLRVCRRYIDFHPIVEGESVGGAKFV